MKEYFSKSDGQRVWPGLLPVALLGNLADSERWRVQALDRLPELLIDVPGAVDPAPDVGYSVSWRAFAGGDGF